MVIRIFQRLRIFPALPRSQFGRGSAGYVVINHEGGTLSRTFQTDLPAVLAIETRAHAFPWTAGILADALASGADGPDTTHLLRGEGLETITDVFRTIEHLRACLGERYRLHRSARDGRLDLAGLMASGRVPTTHITLIFVVPMVVG